MIGFMKKSLFLIGMIKKKLKTVGYMIYPI